MFYLTFTLDHAGPFCASLEAPDLARAITLFEHWAAGVQSVVHASPVLLSASGTKPRGLSPIPLLDHKEWFGTLMGERL